ncbi:MAG: hypothetical protein ACI4KM_03340 [Oscillospiraceae bacterium]
MKYKLETTFNKEELFFIDEYKCEILSEIKLSKTKFKENEIPRRIIKYCGTYIAEIFDDEDNQFMWAILSKYKGIWSYSYCFETLEDMRDSI